MNLLSYSTTIVNWKSLYEKKNYLKQQKMLLRWDGGIFCVMLVSDSSSQPKVFDNLGMTLDNQLRGYVLLL